MLILLSIKMWPAKPDVTPSVCLSDSGQEAGDLLHSRGARTKKQIQSLGLGPTGGPWIIFSDDMILNIDSSPRALDSVNPPL